MTRPDPERLLEDLNPSQREAVEATSGPLAIIAGAGSGKTRIISRRAAYAIESGHRSPADQILLVAFTDKAAGEMVDRDGSARPSRGVMARTFHAAALAHCATSGRSATRGTIAAGDPGFEVLRLRGYR